MNKIYTREATERVFCPGEIGWNENKIAYKLAAFPWHFIGKTCKKCGKPSGEHSIGKIPINIADV